MAKNTIRLNDLSDYPRFLELFHVEHSVTFTNSTVKVRTGETNYLISPRHLKLADLGFVRQVKRHLEKLGYPKVDTGGGPSYFQFSKVRPGFYTDVVELDVNGAYWEIAYQLGYLSEGLYLKGKDRERVSKSGRLIALGAAACTKRTYHFDGQSYADDVTLEVNEVTRSYFVHIATVFDRIMEGVFSSLPDADRLLYWVDAFFVNQRSAPAVVQGLAAHGLECKTVELSSLTARVTKGGGTELIAVAIEGRTEEKTDIRIKPFRQKTELDREKLILNALDRRSKYV